MIEPARFVPLVVLLPMLGLRDKTIFLAARAEHYWVTTLVFFLPFIDMVLAAKLIMLALWWGAATSRACAVGCRGARPQRQHDELRGEHHVDERQEENQRRHP